MYTVDIDVQGLIDAASTMKVAPEKLYSKIRALIEEIQLFLLRVVAAGTPRDRSTLMQGIFPSDVEIIGGEVSAFIGVQGLAATYVWPVELGAKPHWPPIDEIEEWVSRKGIVMTDKSGKLLAISRVAFIISRAIKEHGTIKRFGYHGAQMFGKASTDADAAIEAITDRYIQEFLGELN